MWDVLAVRAGQWSFDRTQVVAFVGPLPVEDLLFGFSLVLQVLVWWDVWGRRRG